MLALAAAVTPARAAELEILTLRHRSADQVLPVLEPLVEQGGALSGTGGKLFLRASAANRAQIRRALAAIDTPLRQLMISVSQDNDRADDRAGAAVSGSIAIGERGRADLPAGGGAGPGASVEIRGDHAAVRARTYGTRGAAAERVAQQIRVLEGSPAFIRIGQSLPVPLRDVVISPYGAVVSESVVYRDLGSGFYVRPQLSGDSVTLEISPQQESFSAVERGAASSHRLSTTVRARLGEWVELGGTNQDAVSERSGSASYSTRGSLEQRRVLLKVEEVR